MVLFQHKSKKYTSREAVLHLTKSFEYDSPAVGRPAVALEPEVRMA